MTPCQGSTSTFYNCCQAVLVVILGDTEAGKQAQDHQALICTQCVHLGWCSKPTSCARDGTLVCNAKVFTAKATVPCLWWVPMCPSQPHCAWAQGCCQLMDPRAQPHGYRARSWFMGTGLPTSSPCFLAQSSKVHLLLPLTGSLLLLSHPLLRLWKLLTTANPSVLRNIANWWLHFIFGMLSYLCRLEIEMSRGCTYGMYGSFKSEINCQIWIFNFFIVKACQRLQEEGESSDPCYLMISILKNGAFSPATLLFSSLKKSVGCIKRLGCGSLMSSWMGEVSKKQEARWAWHR
jgi:hypothetical protein